MAEGAGGREEDMDELAAARLRQYGTGLEDLRYIPQKQYEVLDLRESRALFQGLGGAEQQAVQGAVQAGQAVRGVEAAVQLIRMLDPNNLRCPPVPGSVALEVSGCALACSSAHDPAAFIRNAAVLRRP